MKYGNMIDGTNGMQVNIEKPVINEVREFLTKLIQVPTWDKPSKIAAWPVWTNKQMRREAVVLLGKLNMENK